LKKSRFAFSGFPYTTSWAFAIWRGAFAVRGSEIPATLARLKGGPPHDERGGLLDRSPTR